MDTNMEDMSTQEISFLHLIVTWKCSPVTGNMRSKRMIIVS